MRPGQSTLPVREDVQGVKEDMLHTQYHIYAIRDVIFTLFSPNVVLLYHASCWRYSSAPDHHECGLLGWNIFAHQLDASDGNTSYVVEHHMISPSIIHVPQQICCQGFYSLEVSY